MQSFTAKGTQSLLFAALGKIYLFNNLHWLQQDVTPRTPPFHSLFTTAIWFSLWLRQSLWNSHTQLNIWSLSPAFWTRHWCCSGYGGRLKSWLHWLYFGDFFKENLLKCHENWSAFLRKQLEFLKTRWKSHTRGKSQSLDVLLQNKGPLFIMSDYIWNGMLLKLEN